MFRLNACKSGVIATLPKNSMRKKCWLVSLLLLFFITILHSGMIHIEVLHIGWGAIRGQWFSIQKEIEMFQNLKEITLNSS